MSKIQKHLFSQNNWNKNKNSISNSKIQKSPLSHREKNRSQIMLGQREKKSYIKKENKNISSPCKSDGNDDSL